MWMVHLLVKSNIQCSAVIFLDRKNGIADNEIRKRPQLTNENCSHGLHLLKMTTGFGSVSI